VSQRLAGKVALVTGASGGIGAAVARRFADEGASVIALDLHAPDASLGLAGIPFQIADVTDDHSLDLLFSLINERHAQLDILVTCAAKLGGSGAFADVSIDEWRAYLDVNLTGTFLVCQKAARLMIARGKGGRIITIGSINSFAAEPEASPYVASKGGVRMLTKAMAVDLARHGITVNMIAPGAITVPRNADLFSTRNMLRAFARRRLQPLRDRFGIACRWGDAGADPSKGTGLIGPLSLMLRFVQNPHAALPSGTVNVAGRVRRIGKRN
jgi:NAD(P)-dependent dehydrogenase (short-subunit alcohol dehydrogenase family)